MYFLQNQFAIRPKPKRTPETIQAIYDRIVIESALPPRELRTSTRQFAREFEISQPTVISIIKDLRLKSIKIREVFTHTLKNIQNVALEVSILAFSTNFCTTKINSSGNTVPPKASGFLKLSKMGRVYFQINFGPLKM